MKMGQDANCQLAKFKRNLLLQWVLSDRTKKYYKMKKFLIILIGIIIIQSCSDEFLNTPNPNTLSDDVFWKTEKDANLAITGCYATLQWNNFYGGGPRTDGINSLEGLTDDAYFNWGLSFEDIGRSIHTPDNGGIRNWWASCYGAIGRTNKVIKNIPDMEIGQAMKDRIVAEAKFLRALYYLHLSMTFRDAPLILEPQKISESDVPKNSKAEIVAQIIKDLQEAASVLPDQIPANERGRATSGAALSLLARTYLYNEMWEEAKTTAKKVMDEYDYTLHPSYPELFSLAGENSKEIIFGVEFERGINEGQLWGRHFKNPPIFIGTLPDLVDSYYCIDGLPIDKSPLFQGDPLQTPSMSNLGYIFDEKRYINRDPRLDYTLVRNKSIWQEKEIDTHFIKAGVVFRKWTEEQVGDNALDYTDNALNFQVIRYADVLLMWAEAAVMSGNYNEQQVIDAINQIRQRGDVMMPKVEDVEGTGLSQAKLMEIIKHERRIELAYEGLRYFDLVRWGELKTVWNNVFIPKTITRLYKEPLSNVWPIPQTELENNEVLEQHQEWQ
jgi:starch-binding outer membrane protein, SusD/RagB family